MTYAAVAPSLIFTSFFIDTKNTKVSERLHQMSMSMTSCHTFFFSCLPTYITVQFPNLVSHNFVL